MIYLGTFIADPIGKNKVEPVQINVDQVIPKVEDSQAQRRLFYQEALVLEKALYNSLPGGLYDQLLAGMMQRKVSHFRVPHGGGNSEQVSSV